MDKKSLPEIKRALTAEAEEKFGKERAGELQTEIEQMAEQLAKLYAAAVEIEDEP